jgi:hypothetical protein
MITTTADSQFDDLQGTLRHFGYAETRVTAGGRSFWVLVQPFARQWECWGGRQCRLVVLHSLLR